MGCPFDNLLRDDLFGFRVAQHWEADNQHECCAQGSIGVLGGTLHDLLEYLAGPFTFRILNSQQPFVIKASRARRAAARASSGVAANAVKWPILRPGRGSSLP